jgi:uncharacterized protein YndB with AHSA1/START domain
MATIQITIRTSISAERKKAWDYYTLPEHITGWNFATDEWQCPAASNDLRPGGKYFARMEAKDGSFGFDFEAIYTEIVIGEKFTYVISDGRTVKVSFSNQGEKTEVIVIFDAEAQNSVDLQRDGWQAILDNFKKYVESIA